MLCDMFIDFTMQHHGGAEEAEREGCTLQVFPKTQRKVCPIQVHSLINLFSLVIPDLIVVVQHHLIRQLPSLQTACSSIMPGTKYSMLTELLLSRLQQSGMDPEMHPSQTEVLRILTAMKNYSI